MIPKIRLLVFIFAIFYTKKTYGSAYSNVYVQRGSNVPPLEFLEYGTPAINVPGAQLERLRLPSRPLLSYGVPCAFPCLPSALPNPEVSTYNSPSVPIVVETRKEVPETYDYSYIIYDSNTGDHKSQRELSDGSAVHGQYSLMQPDGYIREVQYKADDLRGFNAVVKNFLPPQADKRAENQEIKESVLPCLEVKNEPLVEIVEVGNKLEKIEVLNPASGYIYEPSKGFVEISSTSPPKTTPSEVPSVSSSVPEATSKQTHESVSTDQPRSEKPTEPTEEEPQTVPPTSTSEGFHTTPVAPSDSQIVPSPTPVGKNPNNEAIQPEINEVVFEPTLQISEIPLFQPASSYGLPNNDYLRCLQALLQANQIAGANKSPLFIILGGKPC